MGYRTHTIHETTFKRDDGEEVDIELEHQPFDWLDMLTQQVDDKIVVAYCVSDEENYSIDDLLGDGMGRIVDAYNDRKQRDELYELLGRDSGGAANIDAVWEKHEDEAIKRYIARVRKNYSLSEVADAFSSAVHADVEPISTWEQAEEELHRDAYGARFDLVEFSVEMEAALEEMWHEPQFFPGDPDAVVLDVYDHSGQCWSISGGGMRCRWDTSSGAGAWVPDDSLREELDSLQGFWAWYQIQPTGGLHRKKYQLLEVVWDVGTPKPRHVEFSDDYRLLHTKLRELAVLRPDASPEQMRYGRECLRERYAQQFLDTYNEIIAGCIFGCVVQVHDIDGKLIDSEQCWGFVGTEYAEQELKTEFFDRTIKKLKAGVPC